MEDVDKGYTGTTKANTVLSGQRDSQPIKSRMSDLNMNKVNDYEKTPKRYMMDTFTSRTKLHNKANVKNMAPAASAQFLQVPDNFMELQAKKQKPTKP